MKATIKRIAEMTGVSRGTVDKVLHDRPGVSDEVRRRIKNVIEEIGYKPNRMAKALNYVQSPKILAVILPQPGNPYFDSMKKGMDSAYERLKDFGVKVEYFFCNVTNAHEVLSILDYLREHKIDALAIRGVQNERLAERLNAIEMSGVPILLLDSDLPGVKRLCLVGEDCHKSGRIAASLLAKSIGGKGTVAVMGGSPDIPTHKSRIQGFADAVKEKYSQINIVEIAYSLEQSVIAYEKAVSLFDRYPDLCGIFSVAGCTRDIGQALIDKQKQGKIKMVCYNFTDDIFALVEKGLVEFTIGLAPFRQGELALETLFEFVFNGEKPKDTFLKTPVTIGIDETIAMYRQER